MKTNSKSAEKNFLTKRFDTIFQDDNQKGSAIVIALLVMVLLLGFVALALSRTNSETVATSNDASETRSFEAAHASLEIMTKNFDKIFDLKLNPNAADLDRVRQQKPPDFEDDFDFKQNIEQTEETKQVVMTGELYQGLNASRDEWQLTTTATEYASGVQVGLRRRFFNNRIPIFQFGIFYDDDLEFHPGPRFDFGGRVHANGSMFLMAQTGLYFSSKVTANGHIFTDVGKNGSPWTVWNENVYIKNASGNYVQLKHNMGSVLQNPVNGSPETNTPDYPKTYKSTTWESDENKFQGNLLAYQKKLELPIKLNSEINGTALDYFELIRRGKEVGSLYNNGTGTVSVPGIVPVATANADDEVTAKERYYNKTGMRISLADSKAKLPGCSSGAAQTPVGTPCGVRLDGSQDGLGANPGAGASRGYTPRPMSDGYQATRINGERFYTGLNNSDGTPRGVWIKIETIDFDAATNTYVTKDITQDILSFGVTEPAPVITQSGNTMFSINGYGSTDSRSIIKLQRFIVGGSKFNSTNTSYFTFSTWNSTDYNYVQAARQTPPGAAVRVDNGTYGAFLGDHQDHWKQAILGGTSTENRWVVPFPINMFDTREGLYHDGSALNISTAYGIKVPWNGVMSMVDIDVANLKAFLDGSYDTKTPNGTPFALAAGRRLKASDIPESNGYVLYISDRRGDYDFDGEYDMEDVYGGNDNLLQPGEDINNNGTLQTDYFNEAIKYTGTGASENPDVAAVLEHKYFRRGVRLVNGTKLPGIYDAANSNNTKGFTVASENGVYVRGNYNATGIAVIGNPTKSTDYLPQNTSEHIPASIAADSVTILSNAWSDAKSFTYPFAGGSRVPTETTVRFAMLSGDTKSSLNGTPNQGGGDPRLSGGVHNFKRFLENWSGVRMNYAGSLINLFNSHNNNGSYKNAGSVYGAPNRNWIFDSTFLDPNRLPPGTPFFQSIQLTGFQRLN